ncbi:MAG TPA: SDR family NAD(P)-dependent oxidoreductase, partial [Actinophytocola sp.]|nr:SDR family NAD(P)-dependent oxidoreductase [Actinophytocola sp.]
PPPAPKPRTTVELTGGEPILAHHRVDDVPILPAVGAVELVRAAADHQPAPGRVIKLRNNVWSVPIMVPEPRTLRIALRDNARGTGYEVLGTGQDGDPVTHVSGTLTVESTVEELERLDVDAVRARCPDSVDAAELYQDVRRRGLDLGPTYQGVTRLHWAENEALAELTLPAEGAEYVVHPGMFDAALQGCLWLLGRRFDRVHLPYSIGEVEILGPTPARGHSHVELRTVTADGAKVDVRVSDEQDRVVLRVRDLWVRPWQPGERVTYFRPEWTVHSIAERRDPGAVLVLAPSDTAGREVAAALGRSVTLGVPGADLAEQLAAAGPVDTVVFAVPDTDSSVTDQLDAGLMPLFHLTRALVGADDKRPVRLVCGVPAGAPAQVALGGLLRTVSLESPRVSHVLVELSPGEPLARLAAEATGSGDHSEVRYRDGERLVRRWETFQPAGDTGSVLRRGGVYLVTGGAGGLGALVARWLAETVAARVVLVGRSPADSRITSLVEDLRTAGGEAVHVRADVSTMDGARAAVGAADKEFGALHGVFHCAGVLRDGYLVRQTEQRLREVVAGKLLGAVHLDAATAGRDLDVLCLFSSLAAAVGSAGQAGYAYANGFLDAYAAGRDGRTVSVNWPLWMDGGMGVDAEVAEWLRVNLGLRPLGTDAGLAALGAVLGGPARQVVVVPGDGAAVGRRLGISAPVPTPATPTVAVGDEAVREFLVGEIADIAKLDPGRIRPDRAIGDYGFDSLSFGTLANRLVDGLGVDLTPAVFFEYTTVAAVAAHLVETYPDELAARFDTQPIAATTEPASEPAPEPTSAVRRELTGPEPIAIIGMHGMLPGSSDLTEFWHNLDAGRDLVTEIPADRWDWREFYHDTPGPNRTNSKWGGFVPDVDRFDAKFFGISPREAELMDPQQRLFLQTAYRAVEEAGYRPSDLAKGITGLFVGVASHDYHDLMREAGVPVEAFTTTGLFHAILANRVSYLLDLKGPSFPIDTACSSSLVALRSAVESIRAGSCDTAIVGGVNLLLSPMIYISFARAGMLSPTGRCRTFDASADGYVRAEGVGALLLKPLSAAERDGDHIHAVIRGSATNHGGKVNTLTTPNPSAQADLIVRAFEEAEVDPATVGYLEMHGTGTALGDPIEINGVKRAYKRLRERAGRPPLTEPTTLIGSVKSNIGHPESAAGIAGLLKIILAMKHGRIPGNLHLDNLNPQIRLGPLSIVDGLTPWPRPADEDGIELPRRAGVSSFGFGGVNAHVLLEEYLPAPAAPASTGEQVFLLSARSPDRLREYAALLADAVRPVAGVDPAAVADAVAELVGVPADQLPTDEPLVDLGATGHVLRRLADSGLTLLDAVELAERSIQDIAAMATGATAAPSSAGDLEEIAYTLRVGRESMSHRLAVVTDSAATLAEELATFATTGTPGEHAWHGVADGPRTPAGEGVLAELARRWVAGAEVDWPASPTGRRPRRVSLPTYPFARDRHWFTTPERSAQPPTPTPTALPEPAPTSPSHPAVPAAPTPPTANPPAEPVTPGKPNGAEPSAAAWAQPTSALGRQTEPVAAATGPAPAPALPVAAAPHAPAPTSSTHPAPTPAAEPAAAHAFSVGSGAPDGTGGTVCQTHLTDDIPLVAEHRVHGQAVLAGVAQLQLATSAMPTPGRLTNVSWTSPLVVPPDGLDVQVHLTERDGGIDYKVTTSAGTHSAGRWCPATGESRRADIEAIRRRCPTERDHDTIYRAFDGIGITYGPTYRGLRDANTGAGELLARYATTTDTAALDAALQAITVLDDDEAGRTRLPFTAEAVEWLAPPALTGYVHVRTTDTGHDVALLDENGRARVVFREVVVREEPDQLDGFFYRPEWTEEAAENEITGGGCLIVHPRRAFGLERVLADRHDGPAWYVELGTHDRRLADDTWEVDADAPAAGLLDCLRECGPFRHVWFLGGITESAPADGAKALFQLIRALGEADLDNRIESVRSVVNGTHDVDGRRVTNPAAAAVVGLTKSLAREYPRLGVSCMDIGVSPGERLAAAEQERLVDGLLDEPARQDNREVALVGERRLVRRLRPVRLDPRARSPFRDGGSYLIIGGAGGIGLALAEHLAATASARLVLVGRRAPDERIEAALARLAELGGQAGYQRADVTDADVLRSVVAKATTHGPLHGVVHAAMDLRDGIVERMSDVDFEAVLAPKADGTRVLSDVLAGEPLDFLLVLSSVQSFTGSAGQANYAAASAAQDAYAHRLAASGRFPVHIVNFGPWAEVGRVAGHRDELTARGHRPIEPALGIRAIVRMLAGDERQLVALHADRSVLDEIGAVSAGPPGAPVVGQVPAFRGDPAEQEALGEFVADALWFAFGRLGVLTEPGQSHRRAALPTRLGAAPRYRRLVDALVQVLLDRGFLVEHDGRVGTGDVVPRPVAPDPEPLRARFPNLAARLELVTRCLAALPDVLRGDRLATEVLFPGAGEDLVGPIYRGEALVDYCNALVADQVAAARPTRVLEVGAGTGSTTEAVLAELADRGVTAEYDATDISAGLLRQADARLDRRGQTVRFAELDIERESTVDADRHGAYDVVVAANVLHATRDLDAVLARLRRLLAPGGRLVLTEVTAVQPFHTVTFGLLDGWWHFADEHRRLPGSPLLDVHLWRHRLAAAGFGEVAVLGHPATPGVLPQRVLVAQVPTDEPRPAAKPAAAPKPAVETAPKPTPTRSTNGDLAGMVRTVVAERVAGCPDRRCWTRTCGGTASRPPASARSRCSATRPLPACCRNGSWSPRFRPTSRDPPQ